MKFTGISLVVVLLFSLESCHAVSSANRTVIFMYFESNFGDSVFLRGGQLLTATCGDTFQGDPCNIAIRTHLLGTITTYEAYNSWRVNDDYLDWHGAEPNQGMYNGIPASGTPLAWTTNNPLSSNYQELNLYGDNYWMVDMEMDCSSTENGWFEVKTFVTPANSWEIDIDQATCSGTVGGTPPSKKNNHLGQCGYINTFTFGGNDCIIDDFADRA